MNSAFVSKQCGCQCFVKSLPRKMLFSRKLRNKRKQIIKILYEHPSFWFVVCQFNFVVFSFASSFIFLFSFFFLFFFRSIRFRFWPLTYARLAGRFIKFPKVAQIFFVQQISCIHSRSNSLVCCILLWKFFRKINTWFDLTLSLSIFVVTLQLSVVCLFVEWNVANSTFNGMDAFNSAEYSPRLKLTLNSLKFDFNYF